MVVRQSSAWSETSENTPRLPLERDVKADVLVIGGGMCGILTAHKLAEAGAR